MSDNNVKVHIAAYRDPDGDVTTVVFVNGEKVKPVAYVVDPGAAYPYPLSEWRDRLRDLEVNEGPQAWKDTVIEFLGWAEDKFTEPDMTPARDMQPGVHDVAGLDPALWIDNGITNRPEPDEDTGRQQLLHEPATNTKEAEYNNTVQAGWAIAALQAYTACADGARFQTPADLAEFDAAHGVEFMPAPDRAHEPVAAAVTTDRRHGATLTETVADLLADLRHLADAKNLVIALSVNEEKDPLHAAMVRLITDLHIAGRGVWQDALDYNIGDIADSAYNRYVEEVTLTR